MVSSALQPLTSKPLELLVATTPTAKRRLLGGEINYLLKQAGMSQSEAGKIVDLKQQRIGAIIKGEGSISHGDLLVLATTLLKRINGVDGPVDENYLAYLADLRRDSNKRGFWTTGHYRAYREDFRQHVDLERHADMLRIVGAEFVPDMLQCESYVRALLSPHPEEGGFTLDDFVQARLERQEVLHRDDPVDCYVVMSESCIHREFGGDQVMREQIDHIIDLSQRPKVQVQIVPFKSSGHGKGKIFPMAFTFQLARVPSSGLAGPLEIVTSDGPDEIRYIDDRKGLSAHERTWSWLTASALAPDATRQYLVYLKGLLYPET